MPALRCPWAGGNPRPLKQRQGMGLTHSWLQLAPSTTDGPQQCLQGQAEKNPQPGHPGKIYNSQRRKIQELCPQAFEIRENRPHKT